MHLDDVRVGQDSASEVGPGGSVASGWGSEASSGNEVAQRPDSLVWVRWVMIVSATPSHP